MRFPTAERRSFCACSLSVCTASSFANGSRRMLNFGPVWQPHGRCWSASTGWVISPLAGDGVEAVWSRTTVSQTARIQKKAISLRMARDEIAFAFLACVVFQQPVNQLRRHTERTGKEAGFSQCTAFPFTDASIARLAVVRYRRLPNTGDNLFCIRETLW